ncbi:unnamed protein product [Peronospora destructor]|uniref:Rab-GAP TBC domain-containing protein n=1 Tax=Peronospora destructor TaxID=86335 RepID=A0AAV0VBV7_9STRA|nr:unnamed protein product [Peronospora destructor]
MGNALVSSICRVHGRSEAVYAIVKAQVHALRGQQLRGSPLQRQCAAQQAALLRALSSNLTLTAAVMSCWAVAATARARAAFITSLVFIAKKFVANTKGQLVMSQNDEDNVFDEFQAVFETSSSRPMQTIRELQYNAKMVAEGVTKKRQEDEAEESEKGETRDDLDDEYEMLPEVKEDWAFYADVEANQIANQNSKTEEGERLLQLVSSISDTLMHVDEFIVSGKHNHFEAITKDVDELAAEASDTEKRSIVRVLLAYCAYNEDLNYASEMVVTAGECLRVWQGDEDRAFKSLVVLCNDVPRLCAALE